MKKILITGATAFLGSNFAQRLKNSHEVHIVTRKKSNLWRISNSLTKFSIHQVDILKKNAVDVMIKEIQPNFVYHFASYGVHPKQKNLQKIICTNVNGTINLMKTLEKNTELEKFVNIGSVFEYGSKLGAIDEDQILEPNSIYGISKAAQTLLTQYYALKKIPAITIRVFTPFGKFDSRGRLISDIMISAIKQNTLNISSPTAKRDFIYIDDVIDALTKILKKPMLNNEIINIGSGKLSSVNNIIKLTEKITGKTLDIKFNEKNFREFDSQKQYGYANIEKAGKILEWKPTYTLEEGLKKTYSWYKKNINLYS